MIGGIIERSNRPRSLPSPATLLMDVGRPFWLPSIQGPLLKLSGVDTSSRFYGRTS